MSLTNNSAVAMILIGTGFDGLACTTTLMACCNSGNPETQWYFPNGIQVPNNPALPYQRTRAFNPGRVILNRNSDSTTTGVFQCDILDASGATRSFYVEIDDTATGESCVLSEWLVSLQGGIYLALQTGAVHFMIVFLYILNYMLSVLNMPHQYYGM